MHSLTLTTFPWAALAVLAAIQPAPPLWPPWLGGLAIGLFVVAFAWFDGHRMGVSSGYYDACQAVSDPTLRASWRLPFLAGIVAGGVLSRGLFGGPEVGFAVPLFDDATGLTFALKAALFTLGGACLGLGARLAGGCTSGHAIMGCAQLRVHSLQATALFFLAATLTTHLVLRGL